MDLITYIKSRNDVQRAWIAEDPANRGACLFVEDVAFWASMGITTVEQFDRSMLESEYSDTHKDAYGVRGRRDLSSLSNEQIEAEIARLRVIASENMANEAEEEPMDFGDLLSYNQRNLDTLERDVMQNRSIKAMADNREWDEKWGEYYERLGA
jgi:hypothetical protein